MIFTGLLSVAFLRSVLRCYKWFGMFSVVAGLLVVGLSDMSSTGEDADTNGIISGACTIAELGLK